MDEPTQGTDPQDNVGNADSMVEYDYKDVELPVPMTDRERLELGQDIAATMAQAEKAELGKKAADDTYNGEIKSAYATLSDLASRLRYGKVVKPVSCQVAMDYRVGTVRIVRLDDGTEVVSRVMTREERQMGIYFDKDKPAS